MEGGRCSVEDFGEHRPPTLGRGGLRTHDRERRLFVTAAPNLEHLS
jgi:hypothetical protein